LVKLKRNNPVEVSQTTPDISHQGGRKKGTGVGKAFFFRGALVKRVEHTPLGNKPEKEKRK